MTVDTEKLERRINGLRTMAKDRNGFKRDEQLCEFLSIKASTLRGLSSDKKLHTMRACDIVMLEILAGERLNTEGLGRR